MWHYPSYDIDYGYVEKLTRFDFSLGASELSNNSGAGEGNAGLEVGAMRFRVTKVDETLSQKEEQEIKAQPTDLPMQTLNMVSHCMSCSS